MDQNLSSNDHDLLIELRTEMRGMRGDLKNLSDGVNTRVSDHENRLRIIEKETENLMGKMIFGIAIFSFIMSIITGVIIAWIKKTTGL